MPVLHNSSFQKSPYLPNGHFESIYPALFRKVSVPYERERLTLQDGDFVDLDWLKGGNSSLVVLTHGLEGDSHRQYVAGMANYFAKKKWDVLAWNCRSCSGEMNRSLRMYHHGEIEDFEEVLNHAQKQNNYKSIVLIGFSMGGNISMKYLGVHGNKVACNIKSCVVFSSPTDLKAGAEILDIPSNLIYKRRFLKYLKAKLEIKSQQYPGVIDLSKFKDIKVWKDFDEFFTAPMNGFANAEAFYENASAKNFMPGIKVPTLLVQAQNDPILPPSCYPIELAAKMPNLYLEMPKHGGHVGFWRPKEEFAWSESRAWEFVQKHLDTN